MLRCECPVRGYEYQVAFTLCSLRISGRRVVWADDRPADAWGGIEGVGNGPGYAVKVVY